ncbi:MAG: ABC transporter ATP-binding protein [Candidatus Izemoplasmatales bacterium]|jgi:putative ABC transport system ATP-binding protein|nr:ABC transporter ATP-binding protein [Candidatus Izemoplasmatales bacterium]
MLIKMKNVSKIYQNGDFETKALNQVDLTINRGEFIVVLGPSGSGKSTFLNVLSGLDTPTEGEIFIDELEISKLNQKELTKFRRENLGFIFQQYNLLSTLTARENIELGYKIAKEPFDIDEMLKSVEIFDQKSKFPSQMSGGQQQRVSIARALVKKPKILFCDEPTGALDEKTGKGILDLLSQLNKKYQTTIVLITHNPAISLMADRVIKMNSGRVVDIQVNQEKVNAADISWS